MKVKHLFMCEYCGFESQNSEEVEACEKSHDAVFRVVKVDYNRNANFPKRILVEGGAGKYAIYQLTGECSEFYNPSLFAGLALIPFVPMTIKGPEGDAQKEGCGGSEKNAKAH